MLKGQTEVPLWTLTRLLVLNVVLVGRGFVEIAIATVAALTVAAIAVPVNFPFDWKDIEKPSSIIILDAADPKAITWVRACMPDRFVKCQISAALEKDEGDVPPTPFAWFVQLASKCIFPLVFK